MKSKRLYIGGLFILFTLLLLRALAAEIYSVQLFFGMSIPGGGTVTIKEWNSFVDNHIVKRFDGFNIVDSIGYWKGEPEHSKIVTIVVDGDKVSDAEAIALYTG